VREARRLLVEAARVYDADPALRSAAHRAARGCFVGGAEWMRAALGVVRGGRPPSGDASFGVLGSAKYAACCLAAAVPLGAWAASGSPWWLLAVVPAFYAAEAQTVFLFPAALDGAERPFAAARMLAVRAGGTTGVVKVVLPLAATMLFGGLLGRGFVRSWCLGCLAVLLWYEDVRAAAEAAPA
jgi:hypothetical protein